jgi:hypothetical protein
MSNDTRFDSRVLEFALRRKEISHQEIRTHLESLPDEAEEAVDMEVQFATPYANRVLAREPESNDSK